MLGLICSNYLRIFDANKMNIESLLRYFNFSLPLVNPVPVADLWHKDVPLKVVMFAWRLF